jgi:hypothetical protein
MRSPYLPLQGLRLLYFSLAGLASAAAIKAMVWPIWPVVEPLDFETVEHALDRIGLSHDRLAALPARRSAELATSKVIGVKLGNELELRVMRGSVKQRFNFQAAFLGRSHPELTLENRKLPSISPLSATGLILKRHAIQTCVVAGSDLSRGFGVTRDQLGALVDSISNGKDAQIKAFLGLRKNREYQCVLISVMNNKGNESIPEELWRSIASSLRSTLQVSSKRK